VRSKRVGAAWWRRDEDHVCCFRRVQRESKLVGDSQKAPATSWYKCSSRNKMLGGYDPLSQTSLRLLNGV
jgi:hypothetical protein